MGRNSPPLRLIPGLSLRGEQHTNQDPPTSPRGDLIHILQLPITLPAKIKAIRFMNNGLGAINVDDTDFPSAVAHSVDDNSGITMIGTELERQILTPLVTSAMTRPLLVMIITEGEVSAGCSIVPLQMCELRFRCSNQVVGYDTTKVT